MIIPEYPNYKVTSDGKVINTNTGRILKQELNNCGYQRVTVCRDNRPKRFFVHRLVAMLHIPNPLLSREVNHKDGNKTNNDVSNLEWCSSRNNTLHAIANGRHHSGERSTNAKLKDSEVIEICKHIENGVLRGEILKLFPMCSKYTFDDIRRRKTWKQISMNYNW